MTQPVVGMQHLVKQLHLAKGIGQLADEGLPAQRLTSLAATALADSLTAQATSAHVTLLQALCQALPLGAPFRRVAPMCSSAHLAVFKQLPYCLTCWQSAPASPCSLQCTDASRSILPAHRLRPVACAGQQAGQIAQQTVRASTGAAGKDIQAELLLLLR